MTIEQDTKHRIDQVAEDVLNQFDNVANEAHRKLRESSGASADSLANINTLTSNQALNSLTTISDANYNSYVQLTKEPAISRVVVKDEHDNSKIYYICRTMPILGMASYRSPVGQLASMPVGAELLLPGGLVEVVERAQLYPDLEDSEWDSIDSVIEGGDYGPFTIESFRALLESVPEVNFETDYVAMLLAQETKSLNIIEGIRRSVITKMGLRDQPILDQYQDEIFRLPLSSRLLILGPPGSGKTTTLIRRLGQKLDLQFLDDRERMILDAINLEARLPHNQNWLMFTPTELLKQYVKEAFSKEGIPAPEARIRTWNNYSHELGRNVLGILRTASTTGTFVLKESVSILEPGTQENLIKWFTDFDAWQKSTFVNEMNVAAEELSNDSDVKVAGIGQQLILISKASKSGSLNSMFTDINRESNQIQNLVVEMKSFTDKKIYEALNSQINRNPNFLKEMGLFIDSLDDSTVFDGEDVDDQDGDEDEDSYQNNTPVVKLIGIYNNTLRSQARAVAKSRSIGKNTRTGKILEWIGDRSLAKGDIAKVGDSLLVQARVRRFVNPVKKYIDGIPKRYRSYRRVSQGSKLWYRKDGFNATDITPLELDVIILAILRSGGEILSVPNIVRDINTPAWSALKPIYDLYKNQIFVDEATDFSPIQIGCMAALAHPRLRSFFACGDFNQRLTTWGSRSVDDMKWVFPEIEIKTIAVSYRQTRQLNEFSHALIQLVGGNDSSVALPEHVNSEGTPPALMEGLLNDSDMVDWLAKRIREIELTLGKLPSIAVLVNQEEDVHTLAESLNLILENQSLRAVACPKGQVLGQDNDVRVFDVTHIKGLEFEAVFFVGIDRLADMHPDLFDKYLYVGATRAATYLGVTCHNQLPESIAELRKMFVSSWDSSVIQ